METERPVVREERALVLDFLPNGYPLDPRPIHKKTAVVQAIGKDHFTILELIPKKGITLKLAQEVYIGPDKRDEILQIVGRLSMYKLTGTAKQELEFVIQEIIHANPTRFINFFNKAQPLSTRMHQLELLPGLGKKHMWEIIQAREEKAFESFADLKARVKLMPNPEKTIVRRILSELEGNEKHQLFVDR